MRHNEVHILFVDILVHRPHASSQLAVHGTVEKKFFINLPLKHDFYFFRHYPIFKGKIHVFLCSVNFQYWKVKLFIILEKIFFFVPHSNIRVRNTQSSENILYEFFT